VAVAGLRIVTTSASSPISVPDSWFARRPVIDPEGAALNDDPHRRVALLEQEITARNIPNSEPIAEHAQSLRPNNRRLRRAPEQHIIFNRIA